MQVHLMTPVDPRPPPYTAQAKNMDAAREALSDMPPRLEVRRCHLVSLGSWGLCQRPPPPFLRALQEELDPVTLHNLALTHMDADPTGGFRKFNFLLQSPPFPPVTFGACSRVRRRD